MNQIRNFTLAGASLLMLAACATTPPGPMIPVAPGPNKSPEAFNGDQIACTQYAENVVQGHVEGAQSRQVASGAIGTAVGAGIGAAAGNTEGAIIGGLTGALIGSQAGAGYDQAGIQQHYDMAYASCMTSRGNEVPGPPPHRPRWYYRHGYAPPPPPPPPPGP